MIAAFILLYGLGSGALGGRAGNHSAGVLRHVEFAKATSRIAMPLI